MKKSLLILVCVMTLCGFAATAQIQRGNALVGGDLANFQISLNEGGNFSMHLSPKAAWFIRDNVALGTYLDFQLATAKGAGTSTAYGIGGLGRYYVNDPTINVLRHSRFFAEGSVGIQGYNPYVGDNTNGLGLGIGPGLAYFITPNVGLEGLLKYNGIIGFGSAVTSSYLNLSIGFQIYLTGGAVRRAATNTQ